MSDSVYLRKLNAQELGYRGGKPKKAGRYFYVSKRFTDYFPPLSEIVKNDYVIIDIIPPESEDAVLTKYVYHNDKIVEPDTGTRDEYRIYLNSGNDPDSDYFKPSDLVIIHRRQSGSGEILYHLYRYNEHENPDIYLYLNHLLYEKGVGPTKAHAVVPIVELPFELPGAHAVRKKVVPKEIAEEALLDIEPEPEELEWAETTRLVRSTTFRDLVMFFYDYKCAITNQAIVFNNLTNLEAAHILPKNQKGPDHPSNGIALCRDLHWAFDKGLFTLDAELKTIVHDAVIDRPIISEIHNKSVSVPADDRARPKGDFIKWHNDHVFGIFLHS